MNLERFDTRPIFDLELGWVHPIGGGEGDEPTPEEKAAAEKAAEDKAAEDKVAADKAAADKAKEDENKTDDEKKAEAAAAAKKVKDEEDAKTVDDLRKENADLLADKKKRDRDAMTESERLIAENKDLIAQNEKSKATASAAVIEGAKQAKLAELAANGENIPPEFIGTIEKVEDIDKIFEEARKRWATVKEGVLTGKTTKLPPGGQASSGHGNNVPADKIERYKALQALVRSRKASQQNDREYSNLRRELLDLGVDVTKIRAEVKT